MDVTELSREQLTGLKQHYLIELASEGDYAEVMGVEWDEPSWGEIAAADEIVPDELVFDYYAGILFSEDDFAE